MTISDVAHFAWLIVLSFAAYRVTRIIVLDAILDPIRDPFHRWLLDPQEKRKRGRTLTHEIYTLTSCTFCTGWWISFLAYHLYAYQAFWNWTRFDWISFLAVAGLQALLHTWEPDNDN